MSESTASSSELVSTATLKKDIRILNPLRLSEDNEDDNEDEGEKQQEEGTTNKK